MWELNWPCRLHLCWSHFLRKISRWWHNGSQLKNPEISGALYTLRIQYSYTQTQCEDGARDVKLLQLTPVISLFCYQYYDVTNIAERSLETYWSVSRSPKVTFMKTREWSSSLAFNLEIQWLSDYFCIKKLDFVQIFIY